MAATRTEQQTVVVAVTLVVTLPDRWGDDCTLGQLRGQATRSAREVIDRVVTGRADSRDIQRILLRKVEVDSVGWFPSEAPLPTEVAVRHPDGVVPAPVSAGWLRRLTALRAAKAAYDGGYRAPCESPAPCSCPPCHKTSRGAGR